MNEPSYNSYRIVVLGTMSSAIFKISLLSSVCIVKVDFCGQLWTMGQGVKSMQKSKVPRFVLQMYLCSCNVVRRGYVLCAAVGDKREGKDQTSGQLLQSWSHAQVN